MPPRQHVSERFMDKVEKDPVTGCWIWTARRSARGYGEVKARRKKERAHRVAYELYVGPIPKGMCVLHRCDNPPCVNPEHLFLGTVAENNRDMAEKHRSTIGTKSANAKLSPALVMAARRAHRLGVPKKRIARALGVASTTIRQAIKGDTWSHVSANPSWYALPDEHGYVPADEVVPCRNCRGTGALLVGLGTKPWDEANQICGECHGSGVVHETTGLPAEPATCSACGAPIPDDALRPLCLRCDGAARAHARLDAERARQEREARVG